VTRLLEVILGGHRFDVLSFPGTTDRIGVTCTILGFELAGGDAAPLRVLIFSV
jgi:hypothetical protein